MSGGSSSPRTRVMLVEDQADFRHLVATVLGRQQYLEVVAQAESLVETPGMPLR